MGDLMSYQALYRVWRSQTFKDIVGQEVITQTLKNAVAQKTPAHAYLFSGAHGTGKTSTAKVFAKAINCLNSHDGEPCNQCEHCVSITEGRCSDIIELDAASNNGVDEIRMIRENVNYAPTEVTYKVYIIDEVHMLSMGAFNALLKTLEEPPEHVIFILATTEEQKIPATILSRTQRFIFKPIPIIRIIEHLKVILESYEVLFEERALQHIARLSQGSMRDALSLLDQVWSYQRDCISEDSVLEVTGIVSNQTLLDYMNYCLHQEFVQAIHLLQETMNLGKTPIHILDQLLLVLSQLIKVKEVPEYVSDIQEDIQRDDFDGLSEMTTEQLQQALRCIDQLRREAKQSPYPDVYLDIVTSELIALFSKKSTVLIQDKQLNHQEQVINELLEKVAILTDQVHQLEQNLGQDHQGLLNLLQDNQQESPSLSSNQTNKSAIFELLSSAKRSYLTEFQDRWDYILDQLTVPQRAMLKASGIVAANDHQAILSFEYEMLCQKVAKDETLLAALSEVTRQLLGTYYEFYTLPKEVWLQWRQEYLAQIRRQRHSSQSQVKEEVQQQEQLSTDSDHMSIIQEAIQYFGEDKVQVIHDLNKQS